MLKRKGKLLIISTILCTSLLGSGLFFNSVQASSKIDTTKLLADNTTQTETIISDVTVLPTDIDGIRSQFNNFVSVTGNSHIAYNMSKLLVDILSDVSYINFRVTKDTAFIYYSKNSTNSLEGQGLLGISYNYKENVTTFVMQNPTVFSSESNGKLYNDWFYDYNYTTKINMCDDINNSMAMLTSYLKLYKTNIANDVINKTAETFANNNVMTSYGGYHYKLETKNDGRIYLQIMIIQLPN